MKHEEIKKLYIEGASISDIATLTNTTRQTIYRYKKKDLEAGVDWDALALANSRDLKNVKLSEEAFLNSLILSYEDAFKELANLTPQEQLQVLKDYSSMYYKLKAPLKSDCKSQVASAITNTIYELSQIALSQDNNCVVEFLSQNSDFIVQKVLR